MLTWAFGRLSPPPGAVDHLSFWNRLIWLKKETFEFNSWNFKPTGSANTGTVTSWDLGSSSLWKTIGQTTARPPCPYQEFLRWARMSQSLLVDKQTGSAYWRQTGRTTRVGKLLLSERNVCNSDSHTVTFCGIGVPSRIWCMEALNMVRMGESFVASFAKVCFAQCSTSRLALGSPGCSFVCRRRRHHAQNTL